MHAYTHTHKITNEYIYMNKIREVKIHREGVSLEHKIYRYFWVYVSHVQCTKQNLLNLMCDVIV